MTPPSVPARSSTARLAVPSLLAGLALGAVSGAVGLVNVVAENRPENILPTILVQLVAWGFWGATAPLLFALASRWPLDRAQWRRHLGPHLLAAVGLALAWSLAVGCTAWLLFRARESELTLGRLVLGYLLSRWQLSLVVYAALVGAWLAAESRRRLRDRETQAARLEAQLARAQLQALEAQLHPHFLFNTLQAISTLVTENPPAARRMLALLGDLLRAVLDDAGRPEVPLARELDFARRYLEIERTRFPDRLAVRIDVDDALLDAAVPSLLLQPLVENAIRHGIAPRAAAGSVEVRAARRGDALVVEVRDDGAGPDAASRGVSEGGRGLGLSATRARLAQLYGPAQSLTLAAGPAGGTVVTVTLPYRPAAA